MSATLSNQAQLRYVLQWFQEWSEMQRGDFLNILIEKCGPPGLVNGLVSSLESLACKEDSDKPPSLFECRAKLFREWSSNWTVQEKETLLTSIKNLDSKFAEKYEQRITKGEDNDDEDKDKGIEKEQEKENENENDKETEEKKEKEQDEEKEEKLIERNEDE